MTGRLGRTQAERGTARLAFLLLANSFDDEPRPGDAAPLRILAESRLRVGGWPEADGHVLWPHGLWWRPTCGGCLLDVEGAQPVPC